jgi:predicted metal-dependent phosphoesterase TrpH
MQYGDKNPELDSKRYYTAGIYDLHVHSSASDGVLTPEELVVKACALKLTGLALSDHDTVDGLSIAVDYIKHHQLPLDFIPAIEMNTELDNHEVHILGYYIDCRNEELKQQLLQIKEARRARAVKMINRLRDMGIEIDMERIQQIAVDDLIARPHIARALLEKGYVSTIGLLTVSFKALIISYASCGPIIPDMSLMHMESTPISSNSLASFT